MEMRLFKILLVVAIIFLIVAAYVLSMANPVMCVDAGDSKYLYANFNDGEYKIHLRITPMQYEILVPYRFYHIQHDGIKLISVEPVK